MAKTNFGYMCIVALTLVMQPEVKVMTHPWVIDNNYVHVNCELDLRDMTLG